MQPSRFTTGPVSVAPEASVIGVVASTMVVASGVVLASAGVVAASGVAVASALNLQSPCGACRTHVERRGNSLFIVSKRGARASVLRGSLATRLFSGP